MNTDLPMADKVQKDTGLKGKEVWWEKRGRGAGETARGTVLMEVESGTTNREAMKAIEDEYQYDYIFRTSYQQFDPDTVNSERVIVAVKRDENEERKRPRHDFYAPNKADVVIV